MCVFVMGTEDAERVGAALRSRDYVVGNVEPALLEERLRQQRPAALVAEVVTLAQRRAIVHVGELLLEAEVEVLLIADPEFAQQAWADAGSEPAAPDEEESMPSSMPAVGQDGTNEGVEDRGEEAAAEQAASDYDAAHALDDALRSLAAQVFLKPVDVDLVVARLAALANDPGCPSEIPETVGAAGAASLLQGDELPPAPLLSYPPAGDTSNPPGSSSSPPGSGWPSSVPQPLGAGVLGNKAFAGPTALSEELERLLSAAEQRVRSEQNAAPDVPSPEAEVNAILPPDVLASLDDPLDASGDEELDESSESQTPTGAGTQGGRVPSRASGADTGESVVPAEPITAHGANVVVASGADQVESSEQTPEPDAATAEPPFPRRSVATATVRNPGGSSGAAVFSSPSTPQRESGGSGRENGDATPVPSDAEYPPWRPAHTGPGNSVPEESVAMASPAVEALASAVPRTTAAGYQKVADAPAVPDVPEVVGAQVRVPDVPEVLTPDFDGLRVLGACVSSRLSAALCFEYEGALCRAVMRDGDFVTCGSSADDESLLAFLMLRGDMPREAGLQMTGRIPPFGRHAAAALIANGFVGQDQLWVVLRAHAEWLLGRMVSTQGGTCAIEPEPKGRLRSEPAVFGGATGAEVLVEVCQRVVPYEHALERLGGVGARLGSGPYEALLSECALPASERSAIEACPGCSVGEFLERVAPPEFAAVLVALSELGVVEILPSVAPAPGAEPAASSPDPLDAEAIRKRVRARLDTIQEGDYFEVVGVSRSATGYEIRRAYLEARRAYEPSTLLTAQTADLLEDVRLIVEVLDEAYELLRDEARRDRYRRALEAIPPSEPGAGPGTGL